MFRRRLLIFIAVVALLVGIGFGGWRTLSAKKKPYRPNTILMTLDTTRMDYLSCYGYPARITPVIDKLAEEGLKYEFAISPSSWTLPAHASIFTGMLPSYHSAHYGKGENAEKGVLGGPSFYTLHPAFPTLTECLKEAGYLTKAIVSGPVLQEKFGFGQGFDHYDDDFPAGMEHRVGDDTTDLAIGYLTAYVRGLQQQPFFLFLNYFDPHNPFSAPAPWGTPDLNPDLVNIASGHYDDVYKGNRVLTAEERELLLKEYVNEIRFMDHQIGRLFSYLKDCDLYDDAFIVITSDHGECFGEHDHLEHGHSLNEELLRVPLIIKYPAKHRRSGVVKERVSTAGVMSTILDYLNLPAPPGVKFASFDTGGHELAAEIFEDLNFVQKYGERYSRNQKAVYDGTFKFIWSSDGKHELYNISNDPLEVVNLYGRMPDLEKRLQAKLDPLIYESNRMTSLTTPELDEELRGRLRALGYIQ
ncbi:MAG: hypothetical protein C4520_18540 [Candidatus Abyssobacteria bacterium SURF_5]|uniref:Sulfatase N-terminal domain-containing protein n=1 Tax=Abyssobacteria bacterium (strain SURF_5) TaxID=2093360 RepID=A0A3A4NB04_ABYX5|nr:MAG: hypothetical protein C4520_18540 [Candidatus Abyssubacteria bacterium SURF_5]